MKRIMTGKITLLLLIAMVSCKVKPWNEPGSGDISGGPCSYDEYRIPARIIVFEKLDSSSIEVAFKLDSNEWIVPPYDTLDFYMETGRYMTTAEADSLRLKKGKALTYLVQRIRSGSCNPEINTLLLEPME